ncbi:MAG: arylesterase [Hyphomicrobiales bacterium]|nr:arylesterase [Hyphomicrobiales bacterium]
MEDLLQETHPEIRVINGSVSGDTTSGGRNRLAWTLDKYHPNLVVLALGGNDVLRGIPPELTRENLAAMLELLKTRDIPVVLSAVQAPENLGAEYENTINSLYPKLAKTYDIPLIPFLIAPTYGNPALMQADGIHPNAEGVKVIAKSLLPILLKHTSTL